MAVNKIVVGIVTGISILGIAGAWAWSGSQEEARKRVRNYILENNLEEHVTYSDVTYNPVSDEVVISEINISGLDDAPQIDSIVVSRLEESEYEEIPREVALELKGVKFNVEQFTELKREIGTRLLSLGYQKLSADIIFEFLRDPKERILSVRMAVSVPTLGGFDIAGKFTNVDLSDYADNQTRQMVGNPMMIIGLLGKSMDKIAIESLYLEYKDNGLVKRYKLFEDSRNQSWPGDPSQWDNLEEQRAKMIGDLKQSGLSGVLAEDIADSLVDFVESPDSIKFYTDMEQPLKLKTLFQSDEQPVAAFFRSTNAKIESN